MPQLNWLGGYINIYFIYQGESENNTNMGKCQESRKLGAECCTFQVLFLKP